MSDFFVPDDDVPPPGVTVQALPSVGGGAEVAIGACRCSFRRGARELAKMGRCRHRNPHCRAGRSKRLLPARSRDPARHRLCRPQRLQQDLRLGPRSASGVRGVLRPRRDSAAPLRAPIPDRPHRPDCRCVDTRTVPQPRGLSRRARLRRAAWIETALSPEERRRGAEGEDAAPAPRDCRSGTGRTIRSGVEGGARSRLRGARDAAVPQDQGGGRGP